MKNFRFIILLLGISLSSNSCENLIDTDLPYNQIGTEQVYADTQSANAALSGLYAELWQSSVLSGDTTGSGAILGTYADDLTCFVEPSSNSITDLYNNIQQPTNNVVYSFWSRAYQHIYYTNAIIEGVRASTGIPQRDKDRLIGEAVTIRSILYLYLQQMFDEIPYTSVTDYNYNSKLSKLSEPALLNQLENDLQSAIPLLEDAYKNPERIFINRKVAELLLAKVHLLKGDWHKAELLLSGIIQAPEYTFENDLTKVFLKTGSHILWQLKPANATDATKEYLLYNFTVSIPKTFSLSDQLADSFEPNDLRKQKWIQTLVFNQKNYYRPIKYKNPANANTNEYSIVFRLEEVYLLYAEALTQQNRPNEAALYIDKIRQRAGLTILPMQTPDTMLTKIKDEWRHEFFAEMGHRFLDLKRLNQLQDLNISKPNWQSFHKALPLPGKELLINPNLKPQNTGY